MLADAPQWLSALENSAFAMSIRQSTWVFPAANVGHILALTLFASAVAMMDLRLLGAYASATPITIVRPARRLAVLGLLGMIGTGFVLFTAEATHVAANPVFQIKAGLVLLGLANAAAIHRRLQDALDHTPAWEPLPGIVRASALLSLLIWISVAACGRLIAYF
jgi:hypothetical protein